MTAARLERVLVAAVMVKQTLALRQQMAELILVAVVAVQEQTLVFQVKHQVLAAPVSSSSKSQTPTLPHSLAA